MDIFKRKFTRYQEKGLEYFCGKLEDIVRAFEHFCVHDPSPMLT